MNIQETDILRTLLTEPYTSQRMLSAMSGHSLGVVNRCLKTLIAEGYLSEENAPTLLATELCAERSPRNAVILAAGYGLRMVPINLSTPKAFLQIHGEPLIERLIRQLHEVGVRDITIVVGFMKERFDYLIDAYGVQLLVNPAYPEKNNLSSLALAADRIGNTYILPADLWCDRNPFRRIELTSWYMVSDLVDNDSDVRVNRRMELVRAPKGAGGNAMIGIAYLTGADAASLRERILEMNGSGRHDEDYWEAGLYDGDDKMMILARMTPADETVEINTYEQLRELDGNSDHLKSDALDVIASVFHTSADQITDISVLKKGMTNRSFLFTVNREKYIMRIPGEGTEKLIDRAQEAEVYRTIRGCGLCDDPVYLNPRNGYKITRFLEGVRVCDAEDPSDLRKCMDKLRTFHELKLSVGHCFDIFGQIDFYESLWDGQPSMYRDYQETKEKVLSLRSFIDALDKNWCLTHIDAVPDNFLFYAGKDGEELQLTDWEYAGMQDPHVDVAMFCIYSLYDKQQCDCLIDIYFRNRCDDRTRAKIYCYIAACGLLWSNWCEFKRNLGVEFGEYSLRQYRYAKDFYGYAVKEMGGN